MFTLLRKHIGSLVDGWDSPVFVAVELRDFAITHVKAEKSVSNQVLWSLTGGLIQTRQLRQRVLDSGQARVKVLIYEQVFVLLSFGRTRGLLTLEITRRGACVNVWQVSFFLGRS